MPSPILFGITVVLGLAAWGAVTRHYIWPTLRERPRPEGLKPILLLHGFRFLGLAFLLPGVVSPDLPAAFAEPGGWRPGFSIPLEWRTCSLLFTREAASQFQIPQGFWAPVI